MVIWHFICLFSIKTHSARERERDSFYIFIRIRATRPTYPEICTHTFPFSAANAAAAGPSGLFSASLGACYFRDIDERERGRDSIPVDPSSFFFSPRHPNGHVETKRRRTFAQQQSRNIERGTRSYPNRRCIVSWTTFTNQNKNVLQRRIFFRTNVIESTNILHTQFITSPFTTRPPPCEIQCVIKMSKRKINTTIARWSPKCDRSPKRNCCRTIQV
jgi:hypothetical protein